MQVKRIETDESLRSKLYYGTPDFPFAFYCDELENFRERFITWHWHEPFECSFVVEGTVVCGAGGHSCTLNAGDGIFINSGVIHSFRAEKAAVMKDVLFAPELIAPENSRIFRTYVEPVLNSGLYFVKLPRENASAAECVRQMEKCISDAADEDSVRYLRIYSDLTVLWQRLFPLLPSDGADTEKSLSRLMRSRVRQMLDFIHGHYGEKLTLDDIALSANISKRETLRCFSAELGSTPMRYLVGIRLKSAEKLLKDTDLPVTAVALETGFDNAGYFCKVFKRAYGVSPLVYRKNRK